MVGVARGIDLLDSILRSAQVDFKPIAMAVLDLEKAFDSVSYVAILNCLKEINVPCYLLGYLDYLYKFSKTCLPFKSAKSPFVHKGLDRVTPCLLFCF